MGNEFSGNLGGKPGAGNLAPRRGSAIRGRGGRLKTQASSNAVANAPIITVSLQDEAAVNRAIKLATKVATKPDREGRPNGNLVLANLDLKSIPGSINTDLVLKRMTLLDLSLNPFELTTSFPNLPKLKSLIIWGNNLAQISFEIFDACSLDSIDFGHNHIGKQIEETDKAPSLKSVKLDAIGLTSLPAKFLANSSHLKVLDLRMNKITIIPNQIENFSHLTTLYLSCNRLKIVPSAISKLHKLSVLHLAHNEIEELDNDCFTGLSSLEILWLNDNKISSLPDSISSLKNLTELLLQDNTLHALPEGLASLAKLVTLDASKNELKSFVSSLSCHKTLTTINLSNNKYESFPSALLEMDHLENLDLSGNKLSKMTKSLQSLKKLRTLNLAFNFLGNSDDTTLSWLAHSPIVEINLTCNKFKSFPKELANLPGLQIIRLCHNFITEDSIPSFENAKGNLPLHIWLTGNLLKKIPVEQFIPVANRIETFCCSSIIPMESIPNEIGKFENLERVSCTIKRPFESLPDDCGSLKKLNRLYVGAGSLDTSKKKSLNKWHKSRSVVKAMMPNALEIDLHFSHPEHLETLTGSAVPSAAYGLYQITGMGSQQTEDTCHVTSILVDEEPIEEFMENSASRESSRESNKHSQEQTNGKPSERTKKKKKGVSENEILFVAVFDGHGGREVSEYAQNNFVPVLKNELKKSHADFKTIHSNDEKKKKLLVDGLVASFNTVNKQIEDHLVTLRNKQIREGRTPEEVEAFQLTNPELLSLKTVGATATVLLSSGDIVIGGNLGDSRSILAVRKKNSIDPSEFAVKELSVDHKTYAYDEIQRIRESNGLVVGNLNSTNSFRVTYNRKGRLLYDPRSSGIAVSRALGDFFASPAISATPHIETVDIHEYEEVFAIVASDGLWDIASNEQVMEVFQQSVKERIAWKQESELKKQKRKAAKLSRQNTSLSNVDPKASERTLKKSKTTGDGLVASKKVSKLGIDDLTAIAANLTHFAFGMGSGDDTAVVIARLK